MIDKKYRPIKIWGLILVFCLILTLTYYIEVKEDRLIVRYSTSSDYNRKYTSMFKTHILLFDNIRNLDVYDHGKYKYVQIILKTGDSISFSIVGFIDRDYAEIKKLIFDVKKKIYESQCGMDA